MRSGLDALLSPRSVAVVGASDDPRRIGGRPIAYMLAAGFEGRLYPVNPRRVTVQGLTAYPSVEALPEPVDLGIVAVPADQVASTVEQLAAKGARAAILFSAGFAETGAEGARLQARVLEIARAAGMRLLGPNCVGLFNARIGHVATFSSAPEAGVSRTGAVALMSQSGAYGTHLLAQARERGVHVGQWVSTGNEADIGAHEIVEAFAADPTVRVIAAYLEGVKDGPGLLRALEAARSAGKPVVVMKVGRSAAGAAAAQAHTASLMGQDSVFDAAVTQHGGLRVETTTEMLDLLYGLSRASPPAGRRLGVVTISGGAGVMMADAAEAGGLELPPLPAEAQERLLERNPFASPVNPVDVTAQVMNDFGMLGEFVSAMLEQPHYDAFAGFFTTWGGSPVISPQLRAVLKAGSAALRDRPFALVILADPVRVAEFEEDGFLVFSDPSQAISTLARMAEAKRRLETCPPEARVDLGPTPPFPRSPINESAAKRILASIGLTVLPEILAGDEEEAAIAAASFDQPLAMKLVSADVSHKSEVGGVVLNVRGAQEARAAWTRIRRSAAEHAPEARFEGVSVAPMAGAGVDLIVGIRNDASFGLVTMVGMGGVFTEILDDVVLQVGPVSAADAAEMIGRLKGSPLLYGARGTPPVDVEAAATAVSRLSSYAAANEDVFDSLEVNPLRVLEEGAVALDALFQARADQPG